MVISVAADASSRPQRSLVLSRRCLLPLWGLGVLVAIFVAVYDMIWRKCFGKKAKTQAEMNVFFQGANWNLAERYTDMVRTTVTHLNCLEIITPLNGLEI